MSDDLNRVERELKTIRELVSKVVFAIADAESEIPEKMRRFMNYMHDVHDIKYMYEELGHDVPQHILRELERLDDRYRQLLAEQNVSGGAFEKVRRVMAADPDNRWDHTKLLPKETEDETRKRSFNDVGPKSGAEVDGNQPQGS